MNSYLLLWMPNPVKTAADKCAHNTIDMKYLMFNFQFVEICWKFQLETRIIEKESTNGNDSVCRNVRCTREKITNIRKPQVGCTVVLEFCQRAHSIFLFTRFTFRMKQNSFESYPIFNHIPFLEFIMVWLLKPIAFNGFQNINLAKEKSNDCQKYWLKLTALTWPELSWTNLNKQKFDTNQFANFYICFYLPMMNAVCLFLFSGRRRTGLQASIYVIWKNQWFTSNRIFLRIVLSIRRFFSLRFEAFFFVAIGNRHKLGATVHYHHIHWLFMLHVRNTVKNCLGEEDNMSIKNFMGGFLRNGLLIWNWSSCRFD